MDTRELVEEWYRSQPDLVNCPLFVRPVRRSVALAIRSRPRSLSLDELLSKSDVDSVGWGYYSVALDKTNTFLLRPKECLSTCKICSGKRKKYRQNIDDFKTDDRQYFGGRCPKNDRAKNAPKRPQNEVLARKRYFYPRSGKVSKPDKECGNNGIDSDCMNIHTLSNCFISNTV